MSKNLQIKFADLIINTNGRVIAYLLIIAIIVNETVNVGFRDDYVLIVEGTLNFGKFYVVFNKIFRFRKIY